MRSSRGWSALARALALALAMAAAASAAGGDDTEAPDGPEAAEVDAAGEDLRFAEQRAIWLGRTLPDLSLTSVGGAPMDLAATRGRWLLLAFADRDSRDEAVSWFETYAADLAATRGLVVYSVLFPGKVSFVVPRAVAIKKIRKEVGEVRARARAGLAEALRPRFDDLELRWHVDWRRRLIGDFGAPRHRLSLLLADPEGRVVAFEDTVDDAALRRVLARVAAAAPEPPAAEPPEAAAPEPARSPSELAEPSAPTARSEPSEPAP